MTREGWIVLADRTRLHATIWFPPGVGDDPVACLLEALPYRKDDITASYAARYVEFAAAGFAVCRLDLRGTGSSSGTAVDEYPATEVDDLAQVIGWLARQPWCTGRVGMFGTSYSGFNSLHAAAAGIAELGAVCATYASDDRFTDDVHYTGGALRAIDVVDYVTYMVAMNALPPVPAIWGDGWDGEWRRRIDQTEPWVLAWLAQQVDGPEWRRGSIRLGPGGIGYERISCPTMLVAGWADGYRNNTFRTVERLRVPWRLVIGPWSHQAPETARPGPNIAVLEEMVAWFDEHLRGGPPRTSDPIQVYVRRWTPPEPDQRAIAGEWRSEAGWPLARAADRELGLGVGEESVAVRPDVGVAAWISCAGALPWGQPLDQRLDDARSIVTDWPVADLVDDAGAAPAGPSTLEILGHARLHIRVRADVPVAFVSAKLCAVAADGTSVLVTRGLLNLSHRGRWPADGGGEPGGSPEPLGPGEWYDVVVELEATSFVFEPGQRLRLSIAGTDWPNIWPPPTPLTLTVDRSRSTLRLPVVEGPGDRPPPTFEPAPGPGAPDPDVVWRIEHDVLGRETRALTHYGGTYGGTHGVTVTDAYDGAVGVRVDDPGRAFAEGTAAFTMEWPEATCATRATVRVASDADTYRVDVTLHAERDGEPAGGRTWHADIPRHLQ